MGERRIDLAVTAALGMKGVKSDWHHQELALLSMPVAFARTGQTQWRTKKKISKHLMLGPQHGAKMRQRL